MNQFIRIFLLLSLFLSFFSAAIPQQAILAQAVAQKQTSDDLQARLAKIEEKVETRRKELGIPGISLVIVKDGQVIFIKGFGYRDFEKQLPVTPDTVFAIGSATKPFTGLSVLMSQEQSKLSLDEYPRKYLPYFKINDPETDEKITIRDLLTHSSGLDRTDLAWMSGKLTREEIIRVAGESKPTAKLRERFQYQNVMFVAAGEIVAKVQNQSYENFILQQILKPLRMTNSSTTIPEMQKSKDFSFGYGYNSDTKETRSIPRRDTSQISPAGAINSSARDMAQWLKFILNKGELNGNRLVSEKGFEQWITPYQKIGGKSSYGLGWFIDDWKGKKVVQHGGNIDGFHSMVATIPEENLGFVMLANVTISPLQRELMPIIWDGILGEAIKITPDELMAKTIEATGGETNWRKLNSRTAKIEIDYVREGLKATGTIYEKVPNLSARTITLTAFGKPISTIEDYFDGMMSSRKTSFRRDETYTGKQLEDIRLASDFYGLIDWKNYFKDAKITGIEKVDGEDAYKVVLKSDKASDVTYYISTKTFLPLKRVIASQDNPISQTFADYRKIDGVMIPFKTTTSDVDMGDTITYLKEVKHNVEIDDKKFRP